ncbi:MAG: hypothetical protein ACK5LN_10420 [Propioniciclava sp.]
MLSGKPDRVIEELTIRLPAPGVTLLALPTNDDDWVSMHQALDHARGVLEPGLAEYPHLAQALFDIAVRYGDLDQARNIAAGLTKCARGLVEQVGTPESVRDLSVSLNLVGELARARGELAVAAEVFAEAESLLAGEDLGQN